jgi:hypothetical protein
MKLKVDAATPAPQGVTRETLALSAWYDRNPAVRRLWAVRGAGGLRVIVALEPTLDSSDIYPLWLANSQAWIKELHSHTGSPVELELIDEPIGDGFHTDAHGELIVAMCWRDPSHALSAGRA